MAFLTGFSYCMLHLPTCVSAKRSLNYSSNHVKLFYTLSRKKLPILNDTSSMMHLVTSKISHIARPQANVGSKLRNPWRTRAIYFRRIFMTSCLKLEKKPNVLPKTSISEKAKSKNQTNFKRLVALANPEKWNLAGNF